VNGTIEKVEGNVVTVATADGSVKVTLGERTRIGKQAAATPADLKEGDRVLVMGERKGDKEYAASVVQVQARGQEQ
jgi:hypothetical protein